MPNKRIRWKPVPGYVGLYEVSDTGLIRRVPSRREGSASKNGKPVRVSDTGRVSLSRRGLLQFEDARAIVLEAFVGPRPEGAQAVPLDGDLANTRLENLAWMTTDGKRRRRRLPGSPRLTDIDVVAIRKLSAEGVSVREIAEQYGVSGTHVYKILNRQVWNHI